MGADSSSDGGAEWAYVTVCVSPDAFQNTSALLFLCRCCVFKELMNVFCSLLFVTTLWDVNGVVGDIYRERALMA